MRTTGTCNVNVDMKCKKCKFGIMRTCDRRTTLFREHKYHAIRDAITTYHDETLRQRFLTTGKTHGFPKT